MDFFSELQEELSGIQPTENLPLDLGVLPGEKEAKKGNDAPAYEEDEPDDEPSEEEGEEEEDEPEEPKPSRKDKKEDKASDEDNEDDENPTFALAKNVLEDLVKDGVLSVDSNKAYDPSMEGVKEIIKDALSKNKPTNLPDDVAAYLKYKEETGGRGTMEDFLASNTEENYSDYNVNNEQDAMWLVEDDLRERGLSDEEIEEEIRSIRERKLLTKRATSAQARLLKNQQERVEAKEKAKQASLQRQQQERQAVLDNFSKKILETESVRGFNLGTASQKKELIEYATKPVGPNGETRYQLERNQDDDLLFLWIKKNKMTLESLKKQAETAAVINFRKKTQQATEAGARKSRNAGKQEESSNEIFWNLHKH